MDIDNFQNYAFKTGLITDSERAVLAAEENGDVLAHNAALLSYVDSGGERTFRLLLRTLLLMGEEYSERRRELEALLPEAGKHWNLLDYVFR